ncbi:MAG TPA: PilZ domain-containing protein [Pseudolabrys sp.]
MADSQILNERRNGARISTHRRGVIRFGPAGQEMSCTIEDLTANGAGLHVATTFGLPRVFRLTIDGDVGSKHCKVIWTDGKRVGVSFE